MSNSSKPLVLGSIGLEVDNVSDHYSLMELFRRGVIKKWGVNGLPLGQDEFWDMLQEYMEHCPKKFRNQEKLARALDELPDHFCRRGKKTEYAMMITKDKKGKYQICYANFANAALTMERGSLSLECFSDEKAYTSLLDAISACKKYLTTRNWKK